MNILITGGSGVIGTRFISKVLHKHKLIAIGKNFSKFPEFIRLHKNFKFYEYDLTSEKKFNIPDKINCILHLAGAVSGSTHNTEDYMRTNVLGTNKLIIFAKENKIPNFILASSVSVYGHQPGKKLVETDLLAGNTDYAISKIDAEKLVQMSGLENYTIFRIASVFGKDTKGFITKLERIIKKRILPFPEDRNSKKSFIHILDLVEFLERAIENPKKGIFNLAHSDSFSFSEISVILKAKTKSNFVIKVFIGKILLSFIHKTNQFLYFLKITKNPKRIDLRPLLEFIEVNPKKAIQQFAFLPKIHLNSEWEHL
ncbi:MAG TPA: NAD(P)-dependent oxidoreductase [Leptospiraceae bacterium]|nr:NAD(P)-dependent oxidoreductase [Leptospiraceae bacterium]HNB99348.1 NAD(P)-dependent oxidoreductase [Leptospiraceae bacterium]